MMMYQDGYKYYISKCEQFGLEPVNFYHFIQQLTQEQLDAFIEQAKNERKYVA